MIGKFFSKLFGGGGEQSHSNDHPPVFYNDFEIISEPQFTNGQWQISGRIEKEIDGQRKVHIFIRADMLPGEEEAVSQTVRKAKLMIDQQGDRIFD
ncbi:HlyU family transcriptional regulator [Roseibium aggregatum]|uniref:Transcriptional regulator n=1 Tax=Roseibium aggregatum TaxID=187304 RepID=A0A926S6G5_9HYPH|nr:HlyU family transcriptional regulator [Roseibium aggregatum]MBD1547195.1 transcriptional regulator [Roseibium aggregatum]